MVPRSVGTRAPSARKQASERFLLFFLSSNSYSIALPSLYSLLSPPEVGPALHLLHCCSSSAASAIHPSHSWRRKSRTFTRPSTLPLPRRTATPRPLRRPLERRGEGFQRRLALRRVKWREEEEKEKEEAARKRCLYEFLSTMWMEEEGAVWQD